MKKLIVLLVLALAFAATACGTSSAPGTSVPPTTQVPTTMVAPTTTGVGSTTTQAPAPTTTEATTTTAPAVTATAAAPTTTAPAPTTTTTAPRPATIGVSAYLLIDEEGHQHRTGPFLVPVYRSIPHTVGTARAAMEALLDGPTTDEASSVPAISTAVPAGSGLNGIVVDDGTATVDLNPAFDADPASAAAAVRVAQVVYTLTQFESIDDVVFLEDGRPVAVQTSDGQTVTRPVGRADYRDFQAIVSVDGPVYGGPAAHPLRVTGEAAVFEAQFAYALTDARGLIIAEGWAMTAEGNTWAPFDFTIHYDVDRTQRGALIVWVDSAEDGSQIDIREYPVTLTP